MSLRAPHPVPELQPRRQEERLGGQRVLAVGGGEAAVRGDGLTVVVGPREGAGGVELVAGGVRAAETCALGEHAAGLQIAPAVPVERHPVEVQPGPQIGPRVGPARRVELGQRLVVATTIDQPVRPAHPLGERELQRSASQRFQRAERGGGLGVGRSLHHQIRQDARGLVPLARAGQGLGELEAGGEEIDLGRAPLDHRSQRLDRRRLARGQRALGEAGLHQRIVAESGQNAAGIVAVTAPGQGDGAAAAGVRSDRLRERRGVLAVGKRLRRLRVTAEPRQQPTAQIADPRPPSLDRRERVDGLQRPPIGVAGHERGDLGQRSFRLRPRGERERRDEEEREQSERHRRCPSTLAPRHPGGQRSRTRRGWRMEHGRACCDQPLGARLRDGTGPTRPSRFCSPGSPAHEPRATLWNVGVGNSATPADPSRIPKRLGKHERDAWAMLRRPCGPGSSRSRSSAD